MHILLPDPAALQKEGHDVAEGQIEGPQCHNLAYAQHGLCEGASDAQPYLGVCTPMAGNKLEAETRYGYHGPRRCAHGVFLTSVASVR